MRISDWSSDACSSDLIVERVSGMPFADYAKKAILRPLGMKRSFFMNDAKPSGTNIAHGYVPVGEGFEIRDTYPTFSGSGGLMVTINDLARFDRDIEVGHKAWTPAVSKIMTTPGTFTNGKPALEERKIGRASVRDRVGQNV